jgi:hypothetical protein
LIPTVADLPSFFCLLIPDLAASTPADGRLTNYSDLCFIYSEDAAFLTETFPPVRGIFLFYLLIFRSIPDAIYN